MAGTGDDGLPVLWHLKASHYNEKARWALDYKQVAHIRRAAVPGRHRAIAERLAGRRTFPVLVIDGRAIGDSTAIIEELERRYPEQPLYPPGPADRRRALELEDYFDEHLGPEARLLFLHRVLPDPDLMLGAFVPDLKGMSRLVARASFPLTRRGIRSSFGINPAAVGLAEEKLAAAGERFRAELQPSGYLTGDSFTVADLTLAALVAPIVAPPQFPYPQPQRGHPAVAPLRELMACEGLVEWTLEIYARHRGSSAEVRGHG
jgi:glutathione S-transferase